MFVGCFVFFILFILYPGIYFQDGRSRTVVFDIRDFGNGAELGMIPQVQCIFGRFNLFL